MATRQPSTDALPVTGNVTAEIYGALLFSKLLDGLELHNFPTLHLRQASRHFKCLLPHPDASPEILGIFDRVFEAAPTVTHTGLAKIFTMKESSVTSPLDLEAFKYFYIRELVFTRQELLDLADYMIDSDDSFEESSEWTHMLEIYGDRGPIGFDTWTLRYVGTVEGPERPVDRLNKDSDDQSRNVLAETFHAVENFHPHIIRDAKVYLLPDVTISPESGRTVENTERLLIELFHRPNETDEFMALETDARQTFKLGTRIAPDSMRDALITHFEEIREYAHNHPAETGTVSHPFTDEVRQMSFKQALPSQFQGYTDFAFLGKDTTYIDYRPARSSLNGSSHAAAVTKASLHRTVDSEAESHDRSYLRTIDDQMSLWCFTSLWPWLWHKNSEQEMHFLTQYMNIVRPLIAVSYGRPVTSITEANFMPSNGITLSGLSAFIDSVAKPSIQFYHHAELSDQPREECAFINIPHIDPAQDKFGATADVRLRRLLEISMQETFVLVDLTLKSLVKHAQDETPLSRLDLCEEILSERESLKQIGEHKTFSESLGDARAQCKAYFCV